MKEYLQKLIRENLELKEQLSKNLDLYKRLGNGLEYGKTFSLWNRQVIICNELEGLLYAYEQEEKSRITVEKLKDLKTCLRPPIN